jgi:hypothetical protein
MRLSEFNQIYQLNFGLSINEQLCYQDENTHDAAYWRFLMDEAERFFQERVKELEQVCIDRLIEVSLCASMSHLGSDSVTPLQIYGSGREDPVQ